MKAARHQHYVPQLHLRYFGDSKGRLWEYDKQSHRCTRRAIKEVAAERDYYSFEDANGEINHQVDANLQKLESEAAGPLKRLVEGAALSAQDRFQISTLIALLYVRTPTFRRTAAELMASGIGALHGCMVSDEEKIENFLRLRKSAGVKSGSIDREKFKQAISAENLSISISKHVGIGLMSIFPNIGELLLECNGAFSMPLSGSFSLRLTTPSCWSRSCRPSRSDSRRRRRWCRSHCRPRSVGSEAGYLGHPNASLPTLKPWTTSTDCEWLLRNASFSLTGRTPISSIWHASIRIVRRCSSGSATQSRFPIRK
jgi:hypothetical protein